MLQRTIHKKLEDFYSNRPGKALMITGARQVGKTFLVNETFRYYAQKNE